MSETDREKYEEALRRRAPSMARGLDALQAGLDAHQEPAFWPDDVCRDAFCGYWERLNGQYYWHRPEDHDGGVVTG
jgi:hypothetical protein